MKLKRMVRIFQMGCAMVLGMMVVHPVSAQEKKARRGMAVDPDISNVAYGKEERHKLDLFWPEGADKKGKLPVLVFVHGGAWRIGDKSQHGFIGRVFADEGFVVAVINYRLHPEVVFPAFVEDAALAVEWVREHAGENGGDRENIFLMGHSAGAEIVALLGADERYLDAAEGKRDRAWLRGVIPVAGPHQFDPSKIRSLAPVFGEFAGTDRPSAAHFFEGEEPPFLVMFGGKDALVAVKQGRDLESAIKKADGEVEIAFYPELGHIEMIAHFAPQLAPDSPLRGTVVEFMRKWSE